MKRICIGVPFMNQIPLTITFLRKLEFNTFNLDEIILVDNGSDTDIRPLLVSPSLTPETIKKIIIIRNKKNVGVREALNQIWRATDCDYILYTHNDLMIHEENWDAKIKKAFDIIPSAGIIGAYGAKGIGTQNIYSFPYKMQQLARGGNVSDARMDKQIHGFRGLRGEYENVAVFDGMFMCIKKELLDKTNGFSDILPSHHNYDNLICIQSLENGYENIVISLDVDHLGGRTDVGENWAEGFGKTKQQVHEEAHPPLWEYGKGILPIFIDDIFSEDGKVVGYQLWMNRKLVTEKIYE